MDYLFIDAVFDAGNAIYLSLDDATNGTELWKSDGTINGTVMVEDFFPGQGSFQTPNSSSPNEFASLNSDLLFAANSELYSRELFKLENAVLSADSEIIETTLFNINLYPNPTTNSFKIAADKNIDSIEIYNLLGKKVTPRNINLSSKTIDVSNLSNGLYLINIKIDNKIISKKIIKN
ncbi:MAG: T9SS type A sorting domain-containing protein [Polaribacter sp.]|nr:T9SS type A sorting domain-containing protein [Polaribacter sp.]